MRILDFPRLDQTFDYDCGAKSIQDLLEYYGFDISEGEIIKIAGTNNQYGTSLHGIKKVAEHFMIKCKMEKMTISDIKKSINNENPVILLVQAWPKKKIKNWKTHWDHGHFVIAIGYDHKNIYFSDPCSVYVAHLSYKELKERWHDIDSREGKKYQNLGITLVGLKKKYNSHKFIHMD